MCVFESRRGYHFGNQLRRASADRDWLAEVGLPARASGSKRPSPARSADGLPIKFTRLAPDGKAPVLHTGMTRLDPGRAYHSRSISSAGERSFDMREAAGSTPASITIHGPFVHQLGHAADNRKKQGQHLQGPPTGVRDEGERAARTSRRELPAARRSSSLAGERRGATARGRKGRCNHGASHQTSVLIGTAGRMGRRTSFKR